MKPNPRQNMRLFLRSILVLLVAFCGFSIPAGVANAAEPVYPVMNTSEYPPDGIYFRNSPDWNDTPRISGHGVYAGDQVRLKCWSSGSNVPRRDGGSNTIWYLADNVTRPSSPAGGNSGWINAHFVNDGTGPNQVAPGVAQCGAPAPAPTVTLAQGPAAPAGYRYRVSVANFPGSSVSVTCFDSVSPGGFYTFSLPLSGGAGSTSAQCYSGDGPDHWVTVNGTASNHVAWGPGTSNPNPAPTITLSQGPVAPFGYRYAISVSGVSGSSVSVTCHDSVSPGGFYTFSLPLSGGSGSTSAQCYSGDGPDHWVTVNGIQSNHVQWGSGTSVPPGGGGNSGSGSGVTVPQAPTKPTIVLASGKTTINGATLTGARNNWHAYGKCMVRDYNSDKGWLIAYSPTKTLSNAITVRNGMLFGWFDNGGGPGTLGCPTSQEISRTIPGPAGTLSLVVQYFQGGALGWVTGMDHAQILPGGIATGKALEWAAICVNSPSGTCNYVDSQGVHNNYAGYCLGFVAQSFSSSNPGMKLANVRYGPDSAASQVWDFPGNAALRGADASAPIGTMTTWGPGINVQGTDGHIALNIGQGYAISTSIGGNGSIHVIRVSDFPPGLQGWVKPVITNTV